ncbi:MAG: T9SS type A sorting domain-containing protein [Saprospiraceae bacterium]|nr:T9SS type A sorting domain-containing protein [Saprospiraceae bacterium]
MKSSLLLLIAALVFGQSLNAQSISFELLPHSPQGSSDVLDIIGDANGNYYAIANNNNLSSYFYRSMDGGNTWEKMNFVTGGLWVIPDGTLYRYTGDFMYRSVDKGQSWTQISSSPSFPFVYAMEVGPTGTLIAQGWDGNIYRSADQGATWETIPVLPSNENFDVIMTTADGDFYALSNETSGSNYISKVYSSVDDGQTWQEKGILPGTYFGGKLFKAASGRVFYYPGDLGGEFFYSDDQGDNWTIIALQWAGSEGVMGMIQQPSGELWIATTSPRRWHSTNNGSTWTLVNPNGPNVTEDMLANIWKMPDGTVFGDFNGALFRANDLALTDWTPSAQGMEAPSVVNMKVLDDDHIYVATSGGIFKTENGGNTWDYFYQSPIFNDDSFNRRTNFCFDNNGNIIMPDNIHLWRIDVGTGTRSDIAPTGSNPGYYPFTSVVKLNNGQLICENTNDVFISNDDGNTWQIFGGNIPAFGCWDAHYLSDSLYILQGIYYAYAFTYNPITNSIARLDTPPVNDLFTQDIFVDQLGVIHLATVIENDHCVSYDFGASWECVDNPDLSHYVQDMVVNSAGTIFTNESSSTEIQVSVDGGYSWNILYPNIDPNNSFAYAKIQSFCLSTSQRIFFADRSLGIFRSVLPTTDQPLVKGKVFEDAIASSNCDLDATEPSLAKVKTQLTGPGFSVVGVSNINGDYVMPGSVGTLTAKALPISEYWQPCEQTVDVATGDVIEGVQLGLEALVQCPKLEVELASPFMRRCFASTVYVHYCNTGTLPAVGATVEVVLDQYMNFLSANTPLLAQNGQTLTFNVGDVAVNHCGYINIRVMVSCDAPLGQMHCVKAHAYPDQDCLNNWTGPWLSSNATCNGSELLITVQNKGGDMLAPVHYSALGHDANSPFGYVLLAEGEVLLAAGGTTTISLPNTSNAVFFQIDQAQGFPYGTTAGWLDITGCGIQGAPFNTFVYDDEYDWEDVLCQPNQGSFDPNDKMAFPHGIGQQEHLDPAAEIEYQIRFQNTGTDTAFTVVVRDLLSPYLDMTSIRPTTSSHPYFFEINDRELVFRFSNIMLPDSNINEPGSHGFIRFAAKLLPNAPIGQDLNNEAAIYFDFNEPVWTNTSHYTIGLPEVLATKEPQRPSLGLRPNPSSGELQVELPEWATQGRFTIEVRNGLGKLLHSVLVSQQSTSPLHLQGLSSGVYLITAKDEQGRTIAAGKWVKI